MKSLFTYLIIIASTAAVGVAGGLTVKKLTTPKEVVYGDVNLETYKNDALADYEAVNKYSGANKANAFASYQIVNYSLEKYRRCEYSYSFGIGIGVTVINQEIKSAQIKYGNTYWEESLSQSSIVGIANRMVQTGVGSDVEFYSAPKEGVSMTGCSSYGSKPTIFTSEKYESTYGRTLDMMFIYIIHKSTVLDGNTKRLDSGEYEVTLSLDPIWSTYRYKLQMKNISSLDSLPVFKSVKLTFTLTSDLELKGMLAKEYYSAKMGFPADITNTINYSYFPNQKYEIPSIKEAFQYKQI